MRNFSEFNHFPAEIPQKAPKKNRLPKLCKLAKFGQILQQKRNQSSNDWKRIAPSISSVCVLRAENGREKKTEKLQNWRKLWKTAGVTPPLVQWSCHNCRPGRGAGVPRAEWRAGLARHCAGGRPVGAGRGRGRVAVPRQASVGPVAGDQGPS